MRIRATGSNASPIGVCEAFGAYGHSILTASPQVDFSDSGVGFSFTPSLRITTYPAGPVIWERSYHLWMRGSSYVYFIDTYLFCEDHAFVDTLYRTSGE